MHSSSSSLPTTFSPGLFYLEALDYAGFDEKCKIDEVFNLIATSSEFMNSAILPQFIMKREYAFDLPDAQRPFLFCNSLQFVRNVNIGPEYGCTQNNDDEDFPIKVVLFLDLLERAGLFNFYTRELRLRYAIHDPVSEHTQSKVNQYFQLMRQCNHLENLSLSIAEGRSGFALAPAMFDTFADSLRKLELFVHQFFSGTVAGRTVSIDLLQKLTSLEELSLTNQHMHDRQEMLRLNWLTPDLPLCRSLKTLKLHSLNNIITSFLPFANFRSLHSLLITESNSLLMHRERALLTSDDFGEICISTARTLTSLKLQSVPLNPGHFQHLKMLTNLRFLDIDVSDSATSLLDLGQLPCFEILLQLNLVGFEVPLDHEPDEYRDMFSKMKFIETLQFSKIVGGTAPFACLDHLPRQAPLKNLFWDFSLSRGEVWMLPQSSLDSVETFSIKGLPFDLPTHRQGQLDRLPLIFPNLISLNVEEFPPMASPFLHLRRLSVRSSHPQCALRASISDKIFPCLQELDSRFMSHHSVEAVLLCKELMKLKDFRKCHLGSSFGKAKIAHFARSFCPFVNYHLSPEEKLEEMKNYRGRVRFADSDDDDDDTYFSDDESECSGSRRQRSEE